MYIVRTTVANMDDAARIADSLVGLRLSPCVQMRHVDSIYRWKGKVISEGEVLLEIKAVDRMLDAVLAAIEKSHPYELPAVEWCRFSETEGTRGWMEEESGSRPVN